MDRLPRTTQLLGIGFYFATCIVGGILGGLGLDVLIFGRALVFLWLGLGLGLVTAFYGGYRMLVDTLQPEASKEK